MVRRTRLAKEIRRSLTQRNVYLLVDPCGEASQWLSRIFEHLKSLEKPVFGTI